MSAATNSSSEPALYRRVWRWHFYSGLVCLPFLWLMASTGSLYLFKEPIESLVYARLGFAEAAAPASASALDAGSLVAKAREAVPGDAVRFSAPQAPGRSADVGIRTSQGLVAVHLDPASGRVLGDLCSGCKLMEVVKRAHSLLIVGRWQTTVEIVAGRATAPTSARSQWPRCWASSIHFLAHRCSSRCSSTPWCRSAGMNALGSEQYSSPNNNSINPLEGSP